MKTSIQQEINVAESTRQRRTLSPDELNRLDQLHDISTKIGDVLDELETIEDAVETLEKTGKMPPGITEAILQEREKTAGTEAKRLRQQLRTII